MLIIPMGDSYGKASGAGSAAEKADNVQIKLQSPFGDSPLDGGLAETGNFSVFCQRGLPL